MQANRTFIIVDASGAAVEADFETEVAAAVTATGSAYGEIDVLAADSGTVTIANTTNYVELTGTATWTLGANSAFDQVANGRLRYTGTTAVEGYVSAVVSMSTGTNNQVLFFRLGINGTTQPATEVHRKTGTGGDVGAMPMSGLLSLTQNDYVSIWVRNTTAIVDVDVEVAHLNVVTIAQ